MEFPEEKDRIPMIIIFKSDKNDKNEENINNNNINQEPKLKVKRRRKIVEDEDEEEEIKSKNEEDNKIIPITKYSSLDPNLFLDEFISDNKCISCGLIPSYETAEEATCCGYLFCEKCKKDWEEKKKCCLKCSLPISKLKTRTIKKFNKIFYKSLKNLTIKCPYKCPWTGLWNDLESHLFKCELSFRYCSYRLIGCEFMDANNKVKEHENNNDGIHLELAMKFIKDKNIINKKLKFEIGEMCMTSCHNHPLKYVLNRDAAWYCDGDNLELGCDMVNKLMSRDTPRYRCESCNFDLCDGCVEKYFVNSFN